MDYTQATLRAATGEIVRLPDWNGYFYWKDNLLVFRNGNFYLNANQLKRFHLESRYDWY